MEAKSEKGNEVRVLVDTVCDLTHYGHANIFRRAAQFGTKVVAGVHSDKDVLYYKGCLPVFGESERYELVRNLKFVDELIENFPFVFTLADLDKHNLLYNAHGDDICYDLNGNPLFQDIRRADRFRILPRTEGVSTTDVIEKILQLNNESSVNYSLSAALEERKWLSNVAFFTDFEKLLSLRKLLLHCQAALVLVEERYMKLWKKTVYVEGDFDIFTVGHLRLLQEAAKHGSHLLVGIRSSIDIHAKKGNGYPLLDVVERGLSVLAYKPVSGILLLPSGHKWTYNELQDYNITTIVYRADCHSNQTNELLETASNYGIQLCEVDSSTASISTSTVIETVLNKKHEYEKRNAKKRALAVKTPSESFVE